LIFSNSFALTHSCDDVCSGGLAHDRRRSDVAGNAVVIEMRVRVVLKSGHGRQRDDLVALGPERSTKIEHESFALRLQLDATAADFRCSSVNSCLHSRPGYGAPMTSRTNANESGLFVRVVPTS
jgi:hypothetical protein